LLLNNHYRAIKLISQGGIGRTFLAVDEPEASQCIIKQFSPQNQGTNNSKQALELFRQEAQRFWE
jgi:serine/threonine protein kinase